MTPPNKFRFTIPILTGLTLFPLLLTACVGTVSVDQRGDSSQAITLEGQKLEQELASSPVRETLEPFFRIGAIWEGDQPGSIEVALSSDGTTWSDWQPFEVHHIEMEESGLFVGQIEVAGDAVHFYRLRGGEGTATYARLEILTDRTSEMVENSSEGTTAGENERGVQLAPQIASVHSRSEWGSRSTRCTRAIANPYRITIHHTETPTNDTISPQARLRSIQRYHMDVRGWCDIGYHYLMSRDGRLWEGRPANLNGAHTGGANRGNLGIAVIGSHDSTPITAAQKTALAGLIAKLANRNNISINRTNIKGHR